jgi:hypothetical protein
MAAAAEQSALPTPMNSAIDRLVNQAKEEVARQNPQLKAPKLRVLRLRPAEIRLSGEACSIPLAEPPPKSHPKFFIGEVPVPKESPDGMPVLKAPVCSMALAR